MNTIRLESITTRFGTATKSPCRPDLLQLSRLFLLRRVCWIDIISTRRTRSSDLYDRLSVGGRYEVGYSRWFSVKTACGECCHLGLVEGLSPTNVPSTGKNSIGAVVRMAVGLYDTTWRKLYPIHVGAGLFTRTYDPGHAQTRDNEDWVPISFALASASIPSQGIPQPRIRMMPEASYRK